MSYSVGFSGAISGLDFKDYTLVEGARRYLYMQVSFGLRPAFRKTTNLQSGTSDPCRDLVYTTTFNTFGRASNPEAGYWWVM